MNINISESLLGDCILVEPAIAARAAQNKSKALVYVENPEFRELWWHHPFIDLVDQPFERSDVAFNPSDAFWEAISLHLPFAAGYFKAFGLDANVPCRMHYKVFGVEHHSPERSDPYICVCPNARSCTSNLGRPANIMPPIDWWKELAKSITYPCFTLGSSEDKVIPGMIPFHGHSFREVVQFMAGSLLIISVETGLLHLAGGISGGPPILFLSSATPEWFSAPQGSHVVRSTSASSGTISSSPVIFPEKSVLEVVNVILRDNGVE